MQSLLVCEGANSSEFDSRILANTFVSFELRPFAHRCSPQFYAVVPRA